MNNLKAHGINAASITYDSPEVLKRFAQANGITFPMLSDVGSKVISAFGILNTNIPADHPMMYGIPWPGDYLIAPDGTVRDKLFLRNYEHRAAASQIITRHFSDKTNGNFIEIKTEVLTATVGLSADRCFPGQELGVTLEVQLKRGWHIYGEPLPRNYQVTELTFESPLVHDQSMAMPPATPSRLKALEEILPLYEGNIRALGKLGIRWSPPMAAKFLQALGKPVEPGLHYVNGVFRFQACTDELCEAPRACEFQIPLTIEAGVPQTPK